jgi:hypothetical protein
MPNSWIEKRKAKRRDILEHFSFYVCIPKLGFARHKVNDVSEMGIGFELDTLGEFKMEIGESCELHFYMNQSLYVPVQIQVVRQIDKGENQQVGAIFLDTQTQQQETFNTLVRLVDQLSEHGELYRAP